MNDRRYHLSPILIVESLNTLNTLINWSNVSLIGRSRQQPLRSAPVRGVKMLSIIKFATIFEVILNHLTPESSLMTDIYTGLSFMSYPKLETFF